MGIIRDAAAAAIQQARSGKRGNASPVTASRGDTPGQESLDRAAAGPTDQSDQGGAGQALKRFGRRLAVKRL